MDDLDLDSFIANIEQSAPQEDLGSDQHRCRECDAILENVEGDFICPNCGAQATNILQLEESEVMFDDQGRAIVGQGVKIGEARKREIDYGWTWSTDEAVVHILSLQVKSLEKLGLVPRNFITAIKNMWLKFWVENIAPFIRDEYNDEDLVPISVEKALKLRDIEVLFKVKDKVMIPKCNTNPQKSNRTRRMLGTRFFKKPKDLCDDEIDISPKIPTDNRSNPDAEAVDSSSEASFKLNPILRPKSQEHTATTKNLSIDSISILTLNRTLAFIEATSRCLEMDEPLFASDIVRSCCQCLIPFFGAQKTLPEGMLLNCKDRLMFKNNRPPSPIQLTHAASLLIYKTYQDRLPISIPVPNINVILNRFIIDLNLPNDLMRHFDSYKLDFDCFKQTRPLKLSPSQRRGVPRLPQYNRWAFAILIFQLKRLFVLDGHGINEQEEEVRVMNSINQTDNLFVFKRWVQQTSIRFHLIMTYDSYSVFHPMTDIRALQPTPQLHHYIERLICDKATAQTRVGVKRLKFDDDLREELTEFLLHQLPRPPHVPNEQPIDQRLEKPIHTRYPIQDAFIRTKRFWLPELESNPDLSDLLFKDFSNQIVVTHQTERIWTVFDSYEPFNKKLEISTGWPYCFRLLLSLGGYICYCKPDELLREYRFVEEFAYPQTKASNRVLRARYNC